jgi:8-amino-7-oxononanoate synthase
MKRTEKKLFGLSREQKQDLIQNVLKRSRADENKHPTAQEKCDFKEINPAYYDINSLPGAKALQMQLAAARQFRLENPYFIEHTGIAADRTIIGGKQIINYSSYNYLGLSGHPRVSQAAKQAIDTYGTSVSASRPVSGERPLHRELETRLARFYGTEDAIILVSGHATNVTTIGYLFERHDLILHDELAHNSIIQGAMLSGAKRLSFPHNDMVALEGLLKKHRSSFHRVLVVIEGLYSMDGDVPPVDEFIRLKHQYKTFLMVDEAHSLGVLGKTGHGIQECFPIGDDDIDLHMGTLSKTLSSSGGYIAAKKSLVDNLKFNAPGFVYSVGLSPPVTAAALESLNILESEPERVEKLQHISHYFYQLAREKGLDTGKSEGHAIIPIIIGSSVMCVKLSNNLLREGINVQPIIYPAVEERSARLRFFLSSLHTEEQVHKTIDALQSEIKKLKHNPVYKLS